MALTPTNGEALLEAARKLVPAIVGARDDIESERRLPSSLVDAMRNAQLFELWLPTTFGGPELHPIDFLRVVEELSRADGSAGWCATVHGVCSLLAGSLSEPAAREISASHAVIAGTVNPTGRARVVDGGIVSAVAGAMAAGSPTASGQLATAWSKTNRSHGVCRAPRPNCALCSFRHRPSKS
jgi:indole-3-acetate monooxygenase